MPRSNVITAVCLTAATLGVAVRASAESVTVPVTLQAEFVAKLAAYDTNLAARAGDTVRVLAVFKEGDPESTRVAQQLVTALAAKATIAGLPHSQDVLAWTDAAALRAACQSRRLAVIYFAPGFTDAELEAVATEFSDANVLTVTAVGRGVSRGVVLGFDIVSGKPKLMLNLTQARKQKVALRPEALSLMKVLE